jgi:hypothetical protein
MEKPLLLKINQDLLDTLALYQDLPLGDVTHELKTKILIAVKEVLEQNGAKFKVDFKGTTLNFQPDNEKACEILYAKKESQDLAKEIVLLANKLNGIAVELTTIV